MIFDEMTMKVNGKFWFYSAIQQLIDQLPSIVLAILDPKW